MAEGKPDPSAVSGERRAMDGVWTLIADVMAGAQVVRDRGEVYLPKYEDEGAQEYQRRLKTAPWRPEFADTLRHLASKPFDKDVGLKGTPGEDIKALAEDIDGRGNSLTRFAAEAFAKGIAAGLHLIFVDFPPMEAGATKAQERAANARPYWLHVEARNIIAFYTAWEGGREVVSHLRFREVVTERDGFGEITVERVRVYEPGRWEVWQKSGLTQEWSLVDEGQVSRGARKVNSVSAVPFFTGDREGQMKVKPPLADLAWMQIELYQALSRQDEVLNFAGSPMLSAEGMAPPADPISVGPKRVLFAPPGVEGVQPRWSFIQPDAANIAEVRKHVESVTLDMRRLGMQPLARQSGSPTATGESIEAAKAHSAVEAWALSLKDALEQAFVFTCEWMNAEPDVEVFLSTDFDVVPFAQAPLTALLEARKAGEISRDTFWDGLRRFDVLTQDFDAEQERMKLAGEPKPTPAPVPELIQGSQPTGL